MRFLSEFVWIPDAFLRDYVTWEGVDDLNAKATITNKGILYFFFRIHN